jgi:hypothetical protein
MAAAGGEITIRTPGWRWLKEQLSKALTAALVFAVGYGLMLALFSFRMQEKALDVKVRMAELRVEQVVKAPAPRIVIPTPRFGPRIPLTPRKVR